MNWTLLGPEFSSPAFWFAVFQIVWINVLLSGDNAVVIALACRGLSPRERIWGMVLGAGIAVLLRVAFTSVVASAMLLPYVRIVGGLALVYIAAKLLVPDDSETEGGMTAEHLWHAVRIIAVADVIMSLDNVIAIAAAVEGDFALLLLGLAISIPMVIAGAAVFLALLDRFPWLIWVGTALLGWIAGEVIATDPMLKVVLIDCFSLPADRVTITAASILGVAVALGAGALWRRKRLRAASDV